MQPAISKGVPVPTIRSRAIAGRMMAPGARRRWTAPRAGDGTLCIWEQDARNRKHKHESQNPRHLLSKVTLELRNPTPSFLWVAVRPPRPGWSAAMSCNAPPERSLACASETQRAACRSWACALAAMALPSTAGENPQPSRMVRINSRGRGISGGRPFYRQTEPNPRAAARSAATGYTSRCDRCGWPSRS